MAKKILIVEDEKLLNEAYELVLKKEGYDVATAFNGQEALDKVAKDKPHLILLDLRMPKMDGVEFLKNFEKKTEMKDVFVIVFSNYDEQKEIDEAFAHGATRYILKAWSSPKELVKVVEETLNPEAKVASEN
jgi:two-component system response regulator VicR